MEVLKTKDNEFPVTIRMNSTKHCLTRKAAIELRNRLHNALIENPEKNGVVSGQFETLVSLRVGDECVYGQTFDGHYNVGCCNDHGFRMNGHAKPFNWKYCPFCGKNIKVIQMADDGE